MLTHYTRMAVLYAIRFYQKTLSRDHGLMKYVFPGGACKFYPTCSEYGYRSVERFGVIQGGWMTTKRVLKCHPWSDGGVDEVPEQ